MLSVLVGKDARYSLWKDEVQKIKFVSIIEIRTPRQLEILCKHASIREPHKLKQTTPSTTSDEPDTPLIQGSVDVDLRFTRGTYFSSAPVYSRSGYSRGRNETKQSQQHFNHAL
jgi:hypothetical protein